MGIEETQARDAGRAPSAPGIGPLINVSHPPQATSAEEERPLSREGESTADVGAPPQTLFVPREASASPTPEDTPVFDAGPARIDLMTR